MLLMDKLAQKISRCGKFWSGNKLANLELFAIMHIITVNFYSGRISFSHNILVGHSPVFHPSVGSELCFIPPKFSHIHSYVQYVLFYLHTFLLGISVNMTYS